MERTPITVFLDFDGTVVEHQYPKMGRANFGAVEVIKKLQDAGHTIVLNTYRADCNDGTLEQALEYLNEKAWMALKDRHNRGDFALKPITATKEKMTPPNFFDENGNIKLYHDGRKQFIFIDDMQHTGTPLKPCCMIHGYMVDWDAVEVKLVEAGLITGKESK